VGSDFGKNERVCTPSWSCQWRRAGGSRRGHSKFGRRRSLPC